MAARTDIPIQQLPAEGAALTWTTVNITDGMEFLNDGSTILVVRNPDAANALNVTVVSVACSHGRVSNIVKAVALTTLVYLFRKLPKDMFNQASGKVNVDLTGSAVTAQVAALRV